MPIEGEPASFRYAQVPLPGIWAEPGSIFVAAPLEAVPFGAGQLLQAMLVIAPVILVGSLGLGYLLAETSLRPLEGIVDETGGDHRRAQPPSPTRTGAGGGTGAPRQRR